MIGSQLGPWTIDAEVGSNEMGRLFRARGADGMAAVKLLTHPKAASPEFSKLFLAQVELLRRLQHPGIVQVLGGGLHNGFPWFAMEWIDGADCQTLLKRGEKPGWTEILAAALQIVPALRHAHRRGVLHRDLRPSNLFRCADGKYKLADFGIVKFFGDVLLSSANPYGSAVYLSPETAAGKPHTKRSDFYSLGGLLWTLIVGRPPFVGATVVELIHKHCFVLPERPIHFVNDLPEEFDRLVMKLLMKEPSQRPGSGTQLMQEFEGLWTLLEKRGLVGKRPVVAGVPQEEPEANNEEDEIVARVPELILRAPTPPLKRWYVVAPLFAVCVLILLWAFFWRGPSADELMSKAQPLLDSHNPADWDKAWSEYLEPLSRKYPDRYVEEVKEAKHRIEEQGELRRAFMTGKAITYRSEAERFYHEGLRLVQSGEYASARRVWENLIVAYGDMNDEKNWVSLAREALDRLGSREVAPSRPSTNVSFEGLVGPVVERIKALRMSGKTKEAESIANALEFLYRDDPEIETLRKMLVDTK